MENWNKISFTELISDRTKDGIKLPTNEYNQSGLTAIIDQGQEFIAGYSDETEGAFTDVPAIIFGDHTRVFKYVDFPFFLGADGVKVLKANQEINYKYLYYFFLQAKFPSTGYARHFKWLKELQIPLPPLEEQKHIAAVLDKCTALIAKHKLMLEKYDTLIKSRFIEMFGDPVQNPKKWDIKKMSDYILFLTSGSRGWSEYFSNEGELFLTIKNVKNNRINIENIQYVQAPNNKEAERTKVQENDLLISITADLGRTGVVSKEIANYGAYINQHLSLVRLNTEKVNPLFVSYYLETDGGKLQFNKKNQSAVKAGLNFEAIKSLTFMNPPLKKQNEFVSFVQQIDKSKFVVQKSLEKAETLYKSLMQEYFG